MGRTPIGEKKMSNAEKQNRYREKQDKEVRREKDRIRKAISHENLKRLQTARSWEVKLQKKL